MTREERELSIEYLEDIKDNYIEGHGYERHPLPEYYAIENAIKALEQQPCEDCISRQVAIDAILKIHPVDTEYDCTLYDKVDVMYVLKSLPPVNPQEPKTGHWIKISPAEIYECDICGQHVMTKDICAYKYCHGCGAKMVEPQESEKI